MLPLQDRITAWIYDYATKADVHTLVVGVSGGIDSAVVSTLCARTGLYTMAVSMPIRQSQQTHDLSMRHGQWLVNRFELADHFVIDLTPTFEQFETATRVFNDELAYANSRSRLRMTTLYQLSQANGGIVVGTGNKIEDFGVGFFTKYGDGGVDISPIADLTKTEVWQLGRELGIMPEIIDAAPTDGLWDDGRTDQDQLGGLSYADLERAMELDENNDMPVTDLEAMHLYQYRKIRAKSLHKMNPIPVFKKS